MKFFSRLVSWLRDDYRADLPEAVQKARAVEIGCERSWEVVCTDREQVLAELIGIAPEESVLDLRGRIRGLRELTGPGWLLYSAGGAIGREGVLGLVVNQSSRSSLQAMCFSLDLSRVWLEVKIYRGSSVLLEAYDSLGTCFVSPDVPVELLKKWQEAGIIKKFVWFDPSDPNS